MKRKLFRIIAIIFLLLAAIHMTGIAAAADVIIDGISSDSCCDTGQSEDNADFQPCSLIDCSCTSCIALDLVASSQISPAHFEFSDVSLLTQSPPPSLFVKLIDYPPEHLTAST